MYVFNIVMFLISNLIYHIVCDCLAFHSGKNTCSPGVNILGHLQLQTKLIYLILFYPIDAFGINTNITQDIS